MRARPSDHSLKPTARPRPAAVADSVPASIRSAPVSRPGAVRLDDLVRDQVRRTPDAVAVVHGGRRWSYAALDRRSAAIAARLRIAAVGPGVFVAIAAERSFDLIAAIVGVLRAGGAYVPLDRAYPLRRTHHILRDCDAAVLIVDAEPPAGLAFDGVVIALRDIHGADGHGGDPLRAPRRSATDPAYVIYTSGTTGKPKGVVLAHTASHLVAWAQGQFTDGELARVAFVTSIGFDPSVFEIFAPLAVGGTVVIKADPLAPFTADERPTLLQGVPSVIADLARAGAIPDSVRVLNLGGEVLTRAVADAIYADTAVERLYNHYGPTEATTCVSVASVARDGDASEPTLGRAICDATLRLLDDELRPVPLGHVGEIVISGPTVACGYLHREALTAARFVADPFAPGMRMYRTGDLGRRDGDGALRFVGRIDRQVKFRGVRIELEEVEAAAATLPQIRRAVAAVRSDAGGRDHLVCVYEGEAEPGSGSFRESLARRLPRAMVPTLWLRVDALPRTPAGKIDHDALPDPVPASSPDDADAGDGASIESIVRAACAEALQWPDLGMDDDLAKRSADSMAIVQLSLLIEQRLARPVGLALLHGEMTPRAIAAALRDRADGDGDGDHVVTLAATGVGVPVFGLPEVHGWPSDFAAIVRAAELANPVYGLVPGPLRAAFVRTPDMAGLVRAYADAIARTRPGEPCVVGGYSFAGVWAHAVAVELRRRGVPVTLLLIDAPWIGGPNGASRPEIALLEWLERIGRRHRFAAALAGIAGRAFAGRGWRRLLARIRRRRYRLAAGVGPTGDRPLPWVSSADLPFAFAAVSAMTAARPAVFEGPTIIVASHGDPAASRIVDHDGLLGWRWLLAGDVRRFHNPMARAYPPGPARLAGTAAILATAFAVPRQTSRKSDAVAVLSV